MNVDAMRLLEEHRGFEAVALLRRALVLDPKNPFTLNNLGVANETIGDFDNALQSYDAAAQSNSSEPAVITLDREWKGQSISRMAAASARRLEERTKKMDNREEQAVMYTLHGVSSTNQNNWQAARKDFLEAYTLNPGSAFSLNNRGFVAEMDGDLETAQFFYDKARKAGDSNARVGLATQHGAEGEKLVTVATDSNHQVDGELDKYSQERRRQTGPIELTPRGNASGGDSSAPSEKPSSSNVPSSVPQLQ
jgi:tetratricopeptide (TPR) repeat protein